MFSDSEKLDLNIVFAAEAEHRLAVKARASDVLASMTDQEKLRAMTFLQNYLAPFDADEQIEQLVIWIERHGGHCG